jgi:hypothetical protein
MACANGPLVGMAHLDLASAQSWVPATPAAERAAGFALGWGLRPRYRLAPAANYFF